MSRHTPLAALVTIAVLTSVAAGAAAQTPSVPSAVPPGAVAPAAPVAGAPSASAAGPAPVAATARHFSRPEEAYAAGAYDQALQGFVDLQVERPDDPAIAFNIGNTHYRMRNYEEAEKSFGQAALKGDRALRAKALYNLGQVAFQQGKLDRAIQYYQQALELDPNDEDAKANVELVRNEIRRRHEAAQKRQEQQQEQGQQPGGQDQPQGQKPPGDQGQQGDGQQQQGQGEQPGSGTGDGPQQGPDQDKDGLSDATETQGPNKTSPQNPDTDGDGIKDGDEDKNHSGAVEADETDPNKADSDGDGVSDGKDPQPAAQAAQGQPVEGQPQGEPQGLSKEQAERYLDGLDERPPERRAIGKRVRAAPGGKDW